MRAVRLAISLLLIPQLAARLLLYPLLIASAALFAQLWLVSLTPRPVISVKEVRGVNLARHVAYGSSAPRSTIVPCIWSSKGSSVEFPPGKACLVGAHDIAILRTTPNKGSQLSVAEQEFVNRLDGNFEKVHLCTAACAEGAGVIAQNLGGEAQTTVVGFTNLLLLNDAIAETRDTSRAAYSLSGQKALKLTGLQAPVSLTGLERQVARLLTLIMTIVCCLWLGLRAHRRVLEYFSSSGSLLPLAASAGPRTLYGALWVITAIRLLAFGAIAAPLMFEIALSSSAITVAADSSAQPTPSTLSQGLALLWFIAITASVVLITLCASIADLKRRLVSAALWRFIPFCLVVLGTAVWSYSLIAATPFLIVLREIVIASPLLGFVPLVASSIVHPPASLVLVHAISAIVLAIILARKNARWFASHLEES